MSTLTLSIDPRRAALREGQPNECIALVRIGAPDAPAENATRKALNLALVIDRSGSMSGQPLEEAKRCAAMIVDRLSPADRAALVVYDNRVDTLVSARPVTDRNAFHSALAEVQSRGSTALFDGWLAGAEQCAIAAEGDYLSRVLLLSDGCANQGLTDTAQIEAHCREMASAGVSTTTCGLGHHFNEELMVAMATAGQGQSYYGESAEDLVDPFTEEFDLLRAICARSLRLHLRAAPGVEMRVLNDYRRDDTGAWILPDIAYGAEVWAVVSLRIPAHLCTDRAGIDRLLTASLSATAGAGHARDPHAVQNTNAAELNLPILPPGACDSLPEDDRVIARQSELRAAALQLEARNAARIGDWNQVDAILRQAEQEATDNPWVAEGLKALRKYAEAREQQRFSKEAMYKSRKMGTRQVARAEVAACYSAADELAVPRFLRRKVEQGKKVRDPQDSTSR